MIKWDRVDHHEVVQVILEGRIVAVPGHHVEARMILDRLEQCALELVHYFELNVLTVFVPGRRSEKVSRISQAISAFELNSKSNIQVIKIVFFLKLDEL